MMLSTFSMANWYLTFIELPLENLCYISRFSLSHTFWGMDHLERMCDNFSDLGLIRINLSYVESFSG